MLHVVPTRLATVVVPQILSALAVAANISMEIVNKKIKRIFPLRPAQDPWDKFQISCVVVPIISADVLGSTYAVLGAKPNRHDQHHSVSSRYSLIGRSVTSLSERS